MKRACVEWRWHAEAAGFLDAIAETLTGLGWQVARWIHNAPPPPIEPQPPTLCDLAVLWNGIHPVDDAAVQSFRSWGSRMLFAEMGWFPHAGTYQLDPAGINSLASWVGGPLAYKPAGPPVVTPGPLLVILQCESDVQLMRLWGRLWCPVKWLRHLARFSRLPMIVRRHPAEQPSEQVAAVVDKCERMAWDDSPTLAAALTRCSAVAAINSTAAIEAMNAGKPVLSYGRSAWRKFPACWPMSSLGRETWTATTELAAGRCPLDRGAMAAMVHRIQAHQWTLADVPHRLPGLLP